MAVVRRTLFYVSIRQHTSAYAYVSIRQHTSAYADLHGSGEENAVEIDVALRLVVDVRQHL
jgi:hypothetical protein